MICPRCGEWAPDQASRCPHCQQQLNAGAAGVANSTAMTALPPEWPSGTYASPGATTQHRFIPSLNTIIASVMIALGAVGLLAFALLGTGAISAHPSNPDFGAAISPTKTAISTATATPAPTMITAINAGGHATGSFSTDKDVHGGRIFTTHAVIDTNGIADSPPQQVYQSARSGTFTYIIPNLKPDASYQVRLYFADFRLTQAGQRQFDVSINGQRVLVNFDIIAEAGSPDRALVKQFDVAANSQGQIIIAFTHGALGSAFVNGLEIVTFGT
jgi:hypothetical protein